MNEISTYTLVGVILVANHVLNKPVAVPNIFVECEAADQLVADIGPELVWPRKLLGRRRPGAFAYHIGALLSVDLFVGVDPVGD
jgi:hypothetical protein